ncbi:hypothetical protein EI42_05815 [Thermosporothrix hazakensis]|uniref:Uncharacterized protein n=2 Tax=Thermosporothrix TaxID=768650 RepID=A0A326TV44_THEHA|nr:hypothetical protein [Thermosporothrix hazakensis]PZW20810.1 hypothetical protein EI42_05815 [Thermosporothrix hazakensis]
MKERKNGLEMKDVEGKTARQRAEGQTQAANPKRTAIIYGLGIGVIGLIINIACAFASSPILEQQKNVPTANALTYIGLGLSCLQVILNLALCFIGGWFIGKRFLNGRLGFWTGSISTLLVYIVSTALNWIPGYPGNQSTVSSPTTESPIPAPLGGILLLLIGVFVVFIIGGIFGQWGSTRAAYKYRAQYAAAEEEEAEED